MSSYFCVEKYTINKQEISRTFYRLLLMWNDIPKIIFENVCTFLQFSPILSYSIVIDQVNGNTLENYKVRTLTFWQKLPKSNQFSKIFTSAHVEEKINKCIVMYAKKILLKFLDVCNRRSCVSAWQCWLCSEDAVYL